MSDLLGLFSLFICIVMAQVYIARGLLPHEFIRRHDQLLDYVAMCIAVIVSFAILGWYRWGWHKKKTGPDNVPPSHNQPPDKPQVTKR
jgi:hypothetical protein